MALSLEVVDRSGRSRGTFQLPAGATVQTLKDQFAAKFPKYYVERQWFTYGPDNKPMKDTRAQLNTLGLANGAKVTFKDLGPQIGYRTVFLVEYFGPLLMHGLCFWLPTLIYGQDVKHNYTQTVAFWCVIGHYVKRELESVFVHRFSNATMPIFNIFKNSTHYWLFGGIFIAYFLYHPLYTAPFETNPTVVNAGAVLFVLGELGNLYSHIILMNLRPPGTKERRIPRGFLFEIVSCANYTCEIFAWAVFCAFTNTLTGYFFLLVSTVQIALWSLKKHKQYIADFGADYKKLRRNILFPFIW